MRENIQRDSALSNNVAKITEVIAALELEQAAATKSKESLAKQIEEIVKQNASNREALDIATHAIEILRGVSDEAVQKSYEFLETSINDSLARMFKDSVRQIKLIEFTKNGQYPQLEVQLLTDNGQVRSLKTDSGHGIAQIISLMCIINLTVITGGRRFIVTDEVLSGLSVNNRIIMSEILWAFTTIGFQFLINDHGFVPAGSCVHHLQMRGGVSNVVERYIDNEGVYLQGSGIMYSAHESKGENEDENDGEAFGVGMIAPDGVAPASPENMIQTVIGNNGGQIGIAPVVTI